MCFVGDNMSHVLMKCSDLILQSKVKSNSAALSVLAGAVG